MGHTNETANYQLSQFLATDKPAWLVDYNGDMSKIDTGIAGVKTQADATDLNVSSISNRTTVVENTINNTLAPAVTTAQNDITSLQGNVTTINSLIGNGTPTTTDQTIIGAINELDSDIDIINSNEYQNRGSKTYSNTALTYGQILNDFKQTVLDELSPSTTQIHRMIIELSGVIYNRSNININYYSSVEGVSNGTNIRAIDLSSATFTLTTINTSGTTTFTDLSNSAIASPRTISVYY